MYTILICSSIDSLCNDVGTYALMKLPVRLTRQMKGGCNLVMAEETTTTTTMVTTTKKNGMADG